MHRSKDQKKMNKRYALFSIELVFLSQFITDIPNELNKCVGMQIVRTHNLNLHNDKE